MGSGRHSITIVGCGPGSPDYVTPAARAAVSEADVLLGAGRLLDLFLDHDAVRIEVGVDISDALDRLERLPANRNIAVLVTGDPGLFSLSKLVIARQGRERCRVIPGVSSVQVAFARIGLDWADAKILSAHKEDPPDMPALKRSDKIAVFCGRSGSFEWIARNILGSEATDRRVFVLENLTLADERIREVSPHELAHVQAGSRTIVVIVREGLIE
jgi:cobalt-precorrin-7 (C5)-methyltransferase